ncbi:MAG: hypothetical protein AAF682_11380 [Planctomycetota bacterium]
MRNLLAVLLPLLAGSCVSTSVTPLTTERYDRIRPHEVRVYMNEADITGRYVEVALIQAEGDSGWTDHGDMVEKARKEAADLGANGILIRSIDQDAPRDGGAKDLLGFAPSRHGQMVAIRVFWAPKRPQPDPNAAAEEETQSFEDWLTTQPGEPSKP